MSHCARRSPGGMGRPAGGCWRSSLCSDASRRWESQQAAASCQRGRKGGIPGLLRTERTNPDEKEPCLCLSRLLYATGCGVSSLS
jgi:hypothetical protein